MENRRPIEAGQPFTIGSPKQLGEILSDKLASRAGAVGMTGRPTKSSSSNG